MALTPGHTGDHYPKEHPWHDPYCRLCREITWEEHEILAEGRHAALMAAYERWRQKMNLESAPGIQPA